jgi:hypothetical protein
MPTVLRWNGCRFYFFSNEGAEPPHIHIDRAKYWLSPVALARNVGYSAKELREIEAKVAAERDAFLEAWRVHFG